MHKKLAAIATASLLAGASVFLTAGPASAHTPELTYDCDSIELNLTGYPAGSTVNGVLDGVDLGTTTFSGNYSSGPIAIDPAVAHEWTITIDSSDGDAFDKVITGQSPAVCLPEPEPEPTVVPVLPPTFDDFCGTENDAVSIPDNTDDVVYTRTDAEDGTITVTATATEGRVFEEGTTTKTWSFLFSDEECPVVTPPTDTPPAVEVPPVVTPPTTVPPVTAPPVLEETTPVTETLPETGADLRLYGLALFLLVTGAVLMIVRKRRTV